MVEQQIYQDQIKPEVEGKVFQTFLSSASSRQTSLQTWIIKKIEDPWRFSCITAGARHYQKEADRWK